MASIRRHIYIEGKVQGVGFRASIRHKAHELNIKGWVKNLYDGRVEAVFSGMRKDVEKMIEYVKSGPRFADVSNIKIHEENYSGEFENFTIRY